MTQYISKSAVVAEIKSRIKESEKLADVAADNNLHNTLEANKMLIRQYTSLLSFLDSLEIKEVDLEKEMEKWIENNQDTAGFYNNVEFAKHFYELGLNTRENKILTKKEKLHLPSGVDEAAWKYGIDNQMGIATQSEKVNAFIAGTEWMAKQGETLYDYINVDGKNQRWLGENLLQSDYDAGQAVIVQIRKV